MKNALLILLIITGVAIAGFIFINNRDDSSNIDMTETITSSDPAEYRQCVATGGKVDNRLAPSSCTLDGKTYTDGNF